MTPKPKMRTKTTLKTALKILHERVYPLASEDKFDEAVEALIASGLEPNTVYASKNRRLFKLLIDGEDGFKNNRQHRRFLEKALDFGCDVDWQDDYGNTYLHYATYRYRPDLIRLLLERGANPNLPEKLHGGVPLYEALSSFALHERARSAQCVEALILGGADIYFCLRGNLTIFDWMNNLPVPCGSKKYDLAKKTFFDALAKRDALRQTSQESETPNAQPSIRKEKTMKKPLKPLSKVTLKVANAAFLEIMPLVYARRFDEALDVLRENRIGPTTTYDGAKRRFLAYFAQICLVFDRQKEDVLDFMKLLVDEEGWDPRYQDLEGMSYLHLAAANRSPDTLRFFLERGVEPDVLNLNDGSPLDIAISYTYHGFTVEDASACVETLILAGADPYRAYSPNSRHIGLLGKIYNSPLERVQQDGEKYPSCAEALFNAIAKRDALRQAAQESETPNA